MGVMFTGIVEKSVQVVGIAKGPKFTRITLASDWPDVRSGESVAVNGACLTVAEIGQVLRHRSPGRHWPLPRT